MDGHAEYYESKQVFNGPYYPWGSISINADDLTTYAIYTLTGIKVDVSNGIPDMVDGTAGLSYYYSIHNKYNTNIDSYNLSFAAITFLGNYIASVDISTPTSPTHFVYKVNMLTGQVVN